MQQKHSGCLYLGRYTMNVDAVAVASFAAIAICVVIVGYLGFKVKGLINKDAKAHRE